MSKFLSILRIAYGFFLIGYFFQAIQALDLIYALGSFHSEVLKGALFVSNCVGFIASFLFLLGFNIKLVSGILFFCFFFLHYSNYYISHLAIGVQNLILICICLFYSKPLTYMKFDLFKFEFNEVYWKKHVHYLFSIALFTSFHCGKMALRLA
jgi:hypothetical protein